MTNIIRYQMLHDFTYDRCKANREMRTLETTDKKRLEVARKRFRRPLLGVNKRQDQRFCYIPVQLEERALSQFRYPRTDSLSLKEYNINRHYQTCVSYDKFQGQFRKDEVSELKTMGWTHTDSHKSDEHEANVNQLGRKMLISACELQTACKASDGVFAMKHVRKTPKWADNRQATNFECTLTPCDLNCGFLLTNSDMYYANQDFRTFMMPPVISRPSKGKWHPDSMKQAVEKMLTGQLYIRKAAEIYYIPKSTLIDRVSAVKEACSTERNMFGTIEISDVNFWKRTLSSISIFYKSKKDLASFAKRSFYRRTQKKNIPHFPDIVCNNNENNPYDLHYVACDHYLWQGKL
ncbi:hypothetical protein ANN_19062 [Periplaneta americana]|uniref:HTH psq-type domain-containing protein n=1 Tax=Periplaneta americana TaxID=6978 RepID=A0ABQ8SRJ7_PERAM|nr:hypothetical protein ANN_19062 [Periplaneta americana]